VWIVLGDHGEAFGQHDGNFGHTFQVYEENVRVPFLIAAPGVMSNQMRTSQIVSLVDTRQPSSTYSVCLPTIGIRARRR
jgi:arylsulfatase A-like enzyme